MGMPAIVEIIHPPSPKATDGHVPDPTTAIETVFRHFSEADARFSPYKPTSEVSQLNDGTLSYDDVSDELRLVLALADDTKLATNGAFDVFHQGRLDPSGLVKGLAIHRAAQLLAKLGFDHSYVEIAGDIQVTGHSHAGEPWQIGIRNPLNRAEIIKVVALGSNEGIATSGVSERGQHIYDPRTARAAPSDWASLTVIGPTVYEADRFATAAFAMGRAGMSFIEQLPGLEAYAVDPAGIATYTSGFSTFVVHSSEQYMDP